MKNAPKSILVTGCAGFIGGNFTAGFAKKYPKTQIIGIDDFSTGRRDALQKDIVLYEGSVLDEDLVETIFKEDKPEYIFHFAALPRVAYSIDFPVQSTKVNVLGTVTLLQAARNHGLRRFIYSSSSSVYGRVKQMPLNESKNPPNPYSPYALQKYVGEPYCRIFSELFEVDTVCLRYFTVFGPGQHGDSAYSTVISAWLESLYFPNNKQGFLEGNGEQTRDFCYIDNVVSANILAMEADEPLQGEVINVAHGEETSLNEVRELIEKITGRKIDLEKRPPRQGDVTNTRADISKAKRLLGYSPLVPFEEGLRQTIDWFSRRQANNIDGDG